MSGFGAAEFQIVHEGEWLPIWEQDAFDNTIHVPGGNENETFLLGLGPLVVTYTLECDDQDAYATLAGLMQTTGTLRIPQTIAENIGSETAYFGTTYTEYSNVTLKALRNGRIALDQSIQVEATFQMQERPA